LMPFLRFNPSTATQVFLKRVSYLADMVALLAAALALLPAPLKQGMIQMYSSE
jgi:hypothetical protein